MSNEFVAEYVQKCINDGVQCPADMRKRAEKEIIDINKEIQRIDDLKVKRSNLNAVVRHLGGGAKAIRKAPSKAMDFTMAWSDLESSFKDICKSICLIVQNEGEDKLPGEIMDMLSREQRSVYSAVKWLEHNEVISRRETDDGRVIIKGSGWNEFMSQFE